MPFILNFGIHTGKRITDESIPLDYLIWMMNNMRQPWWRLAAQEEIKRRRNGPERVQVN